MKEIKWNSKALDFVRKLDSETKREIGALLLLVQAGYKLNEPQSKSMNCIYKSAYELRIKDRSGNYRVIYILNIKDKIFIPHAFNKKTQKTPLKEINISRKRLQDFLNENK